MIAGTMKGSEQKLPAELASGGIYLGTERFLSNSAMENEATNALHSTQFMS